MKTTVTFTKHFTPNSILDGLTYVEVMHFPTPEDAARYVKFLKKHTTEPVRACAGSNYTVSNIQVS